MVMKQLALLAFLFALFGTLDANQLIPDEQSNQQMTVTKYIQAEGDVATLLLTRTITEVVLTNKIENKIAPATLTVTSMINPSNAVSTVESVLISTIQYTVS